MSHGEPIEVSFGDSYQDHIPIMQREHELSTRPSDLILSVHSLAVIGLK